MLAGAILVIDPFTAADCIANGLTKCRKDVGMAILGKKRVILETPLSTFFVPVREVLQEEVRNEVPKGCAGDL